MSERFNIVKRGYDPAEVDQYISSLQARIREYEEKDKAINNALVSAQQAADGIIVNAKNQGRVIKENTAKQLNDIAMSISTQRQMLADFANAYFSVVSRYLKPMDNAEFKAINEKINALESYLTDFSDEISEDLEIGKRAPSET
jgi:DivIVA domain-containing protein